MKKKRKKRRTHTHTVSHLELFFVKIETKEQTIIFLRVCPSKKKLDEKKATKRFQPKKGQKYKSEKE